MTTTTTGPWRWVEGATGTCQLMNDAGDIVLLAHKPPGRANWNLAGDKQLIAHSPSLLTALEDLLEDVPYADATGDGDCECGEFEEEGECCHSRARNLLAQLGRAS